MIRSYFNIHSRTKRDNSVLMDAIDRAAQRGDVDRNAMAIVYGFRWGIQTGRVSQEVEQAFKALTPYRLARLIEQALAANISTAQGALDFMKARLG